MKFIDQAIVKVESLKHLTKWLDSLGSEIHTYSLRGIALHGFEKGFDAAKPPASDFDEAALIAKGWRLQDCKVCGESAGAYVSPPTPDCRTCDRLNDESPALNHCQYCTSGDQYQPAPSVVLWRTE